MRSIAVCTNKSASKTTTKGVWVPVGSWSWTWCTSEHPDLVDHTYRIKTY